MSIGPRICALTTALVLPLLLHAQSFGGLGGLRSAKEATLTRKLPAAVNLNEKRIKIVAQATREGIPADLVPILKTKLVTSVQKDPRFILDERNPETELRFNITNYYVEPRTRAAVGQTPPCTFVTGKIEASYQAVEIGTDAPLDSENLSFAITESAPKKTSLFGELKKASRTGCGANEVGTVNEARDALIDGLVTEMSRRATPFEESIMVPLPGGKLEPLSSLAISQRWAKLLEDAEKSDPLPKPEDDAYRHYLIGLANEALAYQDANDAATLEQTRRGDVTSEKAKQALAQEAKDFDEASAYLDKATKAYKDAMQAKPTEKDFRDPDTRLEHAVLLYATINRHKTEYQEAVRKKEEERVKLASTGGPRGANGPPTAASAPPGSSFNRVIGLCEDHISDIGQLMKDHPGEIRFDQRLTMNEEIRLRKECGGESKGILEAIKAQQPSSKPAAAAKKQ